MNAKQVGAGSYSINRRKVFGTLAAATADYYQPFARISAAWRPIIDLSLFRIIPITETPFVEMDLGILWQEGLSAQLSRTPPSITSSAPVILLDSS